MLEQADDKAASHFVRLHARDNVLICTNSVPAGTVISIDGAMTILESDIELGHKIAKVPLNAGDKVLRYGIAIGSMIEPAAPGAHVHSHNLKSDYIPAHGRGGAATEGRAV